MDQSWSHSSSSTSNTQSHFEHLKRTFPYKPSLIIFTTYNSPILFFLHIYYNIKYRKSQDIVLTFRLLTIFLTFALFLNFLVAAGHFVLETVNLLLVIVLFVSVNFHFNFSSSIVIVAIKGVQ